MKYIKSNYPHAENHFPPFEKKLPGGKVKKFPGVILPRSNYLPHEVAAGKRNVVAISDAQHDRLMADEMFAGMLKAGSYEILDSMPEGKKTQEERIAELEAQNAELQAKLNPEGEKKDAGGEPSAAAAQGGKKE